MAPAFLALSAMILVSAANAAQLCELDLPLAAGAQVCALGAFRVVRPLPAGPYRVPCASQAPITGALRINYAPSEPCALRLARHRALRSMCPQQPGACPPARRAIAPSLQSPTPPARPLAPLPQSPAPATLPRWWRPTPTCPAPCALPSSRRPRRVSACAGRGACMRHSLGGWAPPEPRSGSRRATCQAMPAGAAACQPCGWLLRPSQAPCPPLPPCAAHSDHRRPAGEHQPHGARRPHGAVMAAARHKGGCARARACAAAGCRGAAFRSRSGRPLRGPDPPSPSPSARRHACRCARRCTPPPPAPRPHLCPRRCCLRRPR